MSTAILKNRSFLFFGTALIVGLIYSLPNIYFLLRTPPDKVYLPLSFSELLYGAQVKEVLEGHFTLGDPQFFETKNVFPPAFPLLPVYLLAILSRIGSSVSAGFFLSDLIFPLLLFFILARFSYGLTQSGASSLFAGAVTVFVHPIFSKFPPLTFSMAKSLVSTILLKQVEQPLVFYRTPNPQISFVVLIISLWSLYRLYQKPARNKCLLAAICGAALFTTYFYHAVFYSFVLAGLAGAVLLGNDRKKFRYWLVPIIAAVLVGGLNYYISGLPVNQTLKITGGVFYARYFDWVFTLRYLAVVLLLYLFKNSLPRRIWIFFLVLSCAAILCMNLQLLIGWTIQPGHFPQTTLEPVMIWMTVLAIFIRLKKFSPKLWIILSGIIFVYAILWQLQFSFQHPGVWTITRDLAKTLAWIDTHSDSRTVVTALDSNILAYIPVLTRANIFIPTEEYHYGTVDQIWQRLRYNFRLYGYPEIPFAQNRVEYGINFELAYNVNRYKHFPLDQYPEGMRRQIQSCYPSLCSTLYSLPASVISQENSLYPGTDLKAVPFKLDLAIVTPGTGSQSIASGWGTQVFRSGDITVYRSNRQD